jgi:hypothetical protein
MRLTNSHFVRASRLALEVDSPTRLTTTRLASL